MNNRKIRMDYWDHTHDARLRLTEEEVDRMVSGLSQEAGEHVKLDWWNRRARVEQQVKVELSARFFGEVTSDPELRQRCLEHVYPASVLEVAGYRRSVGHGS